MEGARFFVCQTELGWIGILLSPRGLKAATMPRPTVSEALRELPLSADVQPAREDEVGALAQKLRRYATGYPVSFNEPLDIEDASPFQRAVWQATQAIQHGEKRSYQWLAERIGKPSAARAVGQALGQNPLPIVVPCHRVVTSQGDLGGYKGGLSIKERLLRLEGSLGSSERARTTVTRVHQSR